LKERYEGKSVVIWFKDMVDECYLNDYFGDVERFYLSFYYSGVKAIIYSSPPKQPGMGSIMVSPYKEHKVALSTPLPFVEIGSEGGRELMDYLSENESAQVHVEFSYDDNKYDEVYNDWGYKHMFSIPIGLMSMWSMAKCVQIGFEYKPGRMKTKHCVAFLEFPANIMVMYFVTHGPFYFGPFIPRHQFLLFSHLFPFSGIASSLLVGQFWSAFAESWPNVDKFIDPVANQANRRRNTIVVTTCVALDSAFGVMSLLIARYSMGRMEVLRSLFYYPMGAIYVLVMLYFLSKVMIARRIAKKREDILKMTFYLVCATLFALSAILNFALLGSGYYLESVNIFCLTNFLFFVGRTGISCCDCSIFTASTGSYHQSFSNSSKVHPESVSTFTSGHSHPPRSNIFLDREKVREWEKRLEREMFEKRENEMLVQQEKNLMAFMFHEIRNPLHAIVLCTEYLLETFASNLIPPVQEELQSIASSSSHLQALLTTFLNLDKLMNSKMPLPQEEFTPRAIVDAIATMTRHTVKDGVVLKYEVDDKVKDEVLVGAPIQLRLMLLNLLTNSFRFTHKGSVTLTIDELGGGGGDGRSEDDTMLLSFRVVDTGSGLPDDIASVFNLRQTSHAEGFGVGLYVVNRLAGLMNGTLKARSPIREADDAGGVGSEFEFILALKRGTPKINGEKDKQGEGGVEGSVEGDDVYQNAAKLLSGLSVLLVDDSKMTNKLMKRKFESNRPFAKLNWSISIATTAEVAIQMLKEGNIYDFIMMDEHMDEGGGKLTGSEATKIIRDKEKMEGLLPAVIVGCSGNCSPEDHLKSKQSGQNLLWSKPLPPDTEILNDLCRFIGQRGFVSTSSSNTSISIVGQKH